MVCYFASHTQTRYLNHCHRHRYEISHGTQNPDYMYKSFREFQETTIQICLQPMTLFCTSLLYVCLRLLGKGKVETEARGSRP